MENINGEQYCNEFYYESPYYLNDTQTCLQIHNPGLFIIGKVVF